MAKSKAKKTAENPSPSSPGPSPSPPASSTARPIGVNGSGPLPDTPPTADQVVQTEHAWLWAGFVPRDQLSLWVGDSGTGKSTVLAALAASVSAGREFCGRGGHPPGRVLLYSAEEDPGATIRPRLIAAKADLSRIHLGDLTRIGTPAPRMLLPADLDRLSRRILDMRISLCIIDPLASYLDGSVDDRKDQPVRALLDGLNSIGKQRGCTIVASKHYRKSREGDALAWIGGAPAWNQVPRVIVAFGTDPDAPKQRIMTLSKNQLCAGVRARRFCLVDRDGAACWEGGKECDLSADDLGHGDSAPAERDALADAKAYLLDQLGTEEKAAKELVRVAQESGISLGTLRRAKAALGVSSHPIGDNSTRHIVWRLHSTPDGSPPAGA